MPIYLERLTPRQIADSVVDAVMTAVMNTQGQPIEIQQNELSKAVLDALKDAGIELLLIADSEN